MSFLAKLLPERLPELEELLEELLAELDELDEEVDELELLEEELLDDELLDGLEELGVEDEAGTSVQPVKTVQAIAAANMTAAIFFRIKIPPFCGRIHLRGGNLPIDNENERLG